jgi:glycosyltransferase involved in cell wall biosynthesis
MMQGLRVHRPGITALLPTYNAESIVRRTLESISWVDEIVAVDSFSNDGTLDICSRYGARIIQHEYINSASQKNWALSACSHEWVLQIDTDEVLEEGLHEEIEEALGKVDGTIDAYRMPRKNHMLGKWVRCCGVYPDYQTRLFRKDRGCWEDREVHAHVRTTGRVVDLKHHILHDGMPTLSKQLRNLDRYTRYEADQYRKQGRRFHRRDLLLRPMVVFLLRYFWQQGFREGARGLILSAYLSMYAFLSYAKLWEMEELNIQRSSR